MFSLDSRPSLLIVVINFQYTLYFLMLCHLLSIFSNNQYHNFRLDLWPRKVFCIWEILCRYLLKKQNQLFLYSW